jgi:hypothetical protein
MNWAMRLFTEISGLRWVLLSIFHFVRNDFRYFQLLGGWPGFWVRCSQQKKHLNDSWLRIPVLSAPNLLFERLSLSSKNILE